MGYQYNYGALMNASTTNNNFKPLSEVQTTADSLNMTNALLEAKGITPGSNEANQVMAALPDLQADSQVELMQNVAGLTEEQTAEARGDKWGGSDATMGKSWLEGIAEGTISSEGVTLDDLYRTGFGRTDEQMAADTEGVAWWEDTGLSVAEMAGHFVHSEEAKIRDVYHEEYGRDVDAAGLDWWQNWTPEGVDGDHNDFDITNLDGRNVLLDSVQARGNEWEQAETTVRDLLSSELGLHSTDAQRADDHLLDTDGDGVGDIFTDASEDDVFRMMESADFGASEIEEKRSMQEAARAMGDYGGGDDDVGATRIHRMLSNAEMGRVDATSGEWESDPTTLAKTATDYLPQVTDTTDEDGNVTRTESNVWSLLKSNTQNYGIYDVVKPDTGEDDDDPKEDDDDPKEDDDDPKEDDITVHTEPVIYDPPLNSDVEDTSSYNKSKEAFDNAAAGISTPGQDMTIKSSQNMGVGGSAEGVRLKRSKKFKSGESALGTKQLGRQLQIKSLNI